MCVCRGICNLSSKTQHLSYACKNTEFSRLTLKTLWIINWLNTCSSYLIHLHLSLPWLLSLWVSAFLFLPLEGSDCFFSGVYKQQKEHDPTAALFIYIIAILLWNKFKNSFIKHDFTFQHGHNFRSQIK